MCFEFNQDIEMEENFLTKVGKTSTILCATLFRKK